MSIVAQVDQLAQPASAPNRPGSPLWNAGEREQKPVRIARGTFLVLVDAPAPGRNPVPLAVLTPGQVLLPKMGMIYPGTPDYHVFALTPGEVEEPGTITPGDVDTFTAAFLRHAIWMNGLLLPERLARLLLLASERNRVGTTQELLAVAVGSRRETCSTHLSEWTDEEIINTRYRCVIVRDPQRLEAAGRLR